jgi:hypothetical protein
MSNPFPIQQQIKVNFIRDTGHKAWLKSVYSSKLTPLAGVVLIFSEKLLAQVIK